MTKRSRDIYYSFVDYVVLPSQHLGVYDLHEKRYFSADSYGKVSCTFRKHHFARIELKYCFRKRFMALSLEVIMRKMIKCDLHISTNRNDRTC